MASNKPRRSTGRKAKPAGVRIDAGAKSTATAEAAKQTVKPDASDHIKLVHETDMPDANEFADDAGPDGTDDATAARASALRAILIEGVDAHRLEWRIKRQWPRLKEAAAAIVASAQRTAEGWKPGATRVIGGMSKRVTSIELLNELYVLVTVPGQPACIARRSDAFFMTRDDFATGLADSVIVTGVDSKGAVQAIAAAKVWIGDCRRRTAKKIAFTSRKDDPECFNLWTGFGVAPKAGRCDVIHQHIREVICAGDATKYEAFLNLLAWQMQNIGRASRIIVVLYSKEQQVGKGVLIEKILPEIFGLLHGAFTSEYEHVFGRFNDFMRGKAYVALDEACFAGDRKAADKIKSTAAAETMSIEAKGLPKIQCPVGVNIFLATNHEHAAHVEQHDARYWILKVSPHRKNDRDYWASLLDEIDNGGIAALLHDLLARDVSSFVPQRDVPLQNAEHRENQRASDPANPALWLLDCVDNGLWLGSEKWGSVYSPDLPAKDHQGAISIAHDDGGAKVLPAFLEWSYRAWSAGQGRHAQPATTGEFWKLLTALGFDARRPGGRRIRIVPESEKLRAKVTEHLGIDDDDNDAKTEGCAGSDGRTGDFSLSPKTAGKSSTENIYPGFSGDGGIQLSPTVTSSKNGSNGSNLGGDSRGVTVGVTVGDGSHDSRGGNRHASGTFTGTASSHAHQANGSHGFNGGSVGEADGKQPRGTHTSGILNRCSVAAALAALDDDGCSDFDEPDARVNGEPARVTL